MSMTKKFLIACLIIFFSISGYIYGHALLDIFGQQGGAPHENGVSHNRFNRFDRLAFCTQDGYSLPALPALCRAFLSSSDLAKEEISNLNTYGGIVALFALKDEDFANETIPHLLKQGLDINAIQKNIEGSEAQNWTALHRAVIESNLIWIRSLLKNGANQNLKDAKGRTALQLAEEISLQHPENIDAKNAIELLKP